MLKWKARDKYYMDGGNGYTISKDSTTKRYSSWPPKPKKIEYGESYESEKHTHHSMGVFDTLAEAKECCQKHYDNT